MLAVAVPLSATVTPLVAGLIVPEMLQIEVDVALKLFPVELAPLIVTDWDVGLKVKPVLPGVTV